MSDQKTEQKPEHEKRIREALEAGPTEGPWFEHHHKGRLYIENQRDDVVCDMGLRVKSNPTSQFIAACNPSAIRALLADLDAMRAIEDEVRHLLWGTHPECCGRPCVGAQYMGQSEMVCCGEFDSDTLSDAQIVVSLRARFPQEIAALKGASHE